MPTKSDSRQHLLRQVINIVAFVAMAVISIVGATVPFNHNYFMEVVSRYNPDFMMPGYVHYVFGLVLLVSLLLFIIYQACPKHRHDSMVRSIDYPFWILVIASIIWTFGFYYDVMWLCFVSIIISAIAAYYIFMTIGVGKAKVKNSVYWYVHVPFSLLAAATIFHIVTTVAMFCIRYNLIWWGIGQTAWTVVAMLVVAFFGSLLMNKRTDLVFGLTLVWFSAGIVTYQHGHNAIVTDFAYILTAYFALVTYFTCFHCPREVSKGK